ncbi:ATP-binding protein [Candidatus Tokpelaia sp.]|uniref:ATP-binding protein n=1 Tax=Candidatus Tokpelaia sp. TaxID=2233777 RepID=UPI00123B6B2B|nr:ATP-binding protein [Candidatus Tokpelaia sp.]KAA6405801.1 ATP-binding protein [Candidatus Tokpelaia sp.]
MIPHSLPPRASSLTESMRDIGYSPETAIADIIDNSIAAHASEVCIRFDFESPSPWLCIIDNGSGMNRKELIAAMRYGSKRLRPERTADDLGRFGLGLKTASFSQCRRLTVVTSQNKKLEAAAWDLDIVSEKDEWVLGILEPAEISALPCIAESGATGTMVLWEKLDRLCDNSAPDKTLLYEKMEMVDRHLALVFHRFLTGDARSGKLVIKMNGHALEPFDPFCLSNRATQLLPEEICRIRGHEVRIQPYILPHHSKLSPHEYDYYQSRSEFVTNQGVYIYRNKRLMAWGNWLRLAPKGEAARLARVKIDFPNALDELWTIDIKKSRAYPPPQVKDTLRQVLNRIIEQSTRVHIGRGRKLFDENPEPCWSRCAEHGGVHYSVNKEHPVIASYRQMLDPEQQRLFQEVLSVIEEAVPVEAIYSDYSITPKNFDDTAAFERAAIAQRLDLLFKILSAEKPPEADAFRKTVNNLKPFCNYPQETEQLIKEKFHA